MSRETAPIVGLDIGTSKVVAIAGDIDASGNLVVLGIGCCAFDNLHPRGLRKGMVVNIEATVSAISHAIKEVESVAGCTVREVYTGIAGTHIKSKESDGVTVVREQEVAQYDIDRAIETAKATPISADDRLLHTLIQEFIVDGQDGVKAPIGMNARRLAVKVLIATGAETAVGNILKCVRRCGLEVKELMLQPLASSRAVISEDEKEVGVCLVDIGGGTTDVAIFAQGSIRHIAIIPIAGDQITSDIGIALRTSTQDAEDIKIRYGVALRELAQPGDLIEVPGIGDRPATTMSRQELTSVIQPRVEEIFQHVQVALDQSGFAHLLRAGVVLTGGSASMSGMTGLGEEIFDSTVKIGVPNYSGALRDLVRNPKYASAMGLLFEGAVLRHSDLIRHAHPVNYRQAIGRMRAWFQNTF